MKIVSKIKLPASNRDGDLYAVKTECGKNFIVLTADTSYFEEKFEGMESTDQFEISELAFKELLRHPWQSK
tara:strand:- start:266 stop:478 length:213 start_codon:yes stop_codon:yes gene_type:complete